MGKPLLGMSSFDHYLQIGGNLQAHDLFEILYLELALFRLDDAHQLVVILHGLYVIFLLMHAHGKILVTSCIFVC